MSSDRKPSLLSKLRPTNSQDSAPSPTRSPKSPEPASCSPSAVHLERVVTTISHEDTKCGDFGYLGPYPKPLRSTMSKIKKAFTPDPTGRALHYPEAR